MRRYHLSKKKIKEIRKSLAFPLWKDGAYEIFENDIVLILRDGKPAYFLWEGRYYPTVYFLLEETPSNYFVTVDMGAVRHVLNGANIFAAGVVDADPKIEENSVVYVRDEKYLKPLAVGIALISGKEMIYSKEGMAVKILHYYGDKISKIL